MKRSTDKGKSWQALQTVVDYDTLQAGNAAPVVDLTDPAYPKGRIFLFYNTGNAHEYEVRSGKGLREAWYITSADNGQTWSAPVNITTQVHRPNMPAANPAYTFQEDWRAYANTPGHAMQFAEGRYKGRIYVAANHSEGSPKNTAEDYFAHGYYTDDHGKTFKISETVPETGGNEAMAAELTNGRLMMNIRNQQGDVRARIVAISSDGGATWDTTYFDQQLPDPVNQGSILTIGKKKGKAILAFCNAADTKSRDNLTLRISYDEGKTWKEQHVIAKSENNTKDYAAYSDLVKVGKKSLGCCMRKMHTRKSYLR
jgi:sialidase-1